MKLFRSLLTTGLYCLLAATAIFMITGAEPIPVAAVLFTLSHIGMPNGLSFMGVTTQGQRIIFANAVNMLAEQDVPIDRAILTQGYLRLEQAMVVGQTNILFPVLVNQSTGGQFNTEQRLQLQDSFVVSELGIFWFLPNGSTTDTSTPLLSWPNPTLFTTAGAAAAAETLYHSYLTLAVNKVVLVPYWDIQRSRLANQTQQTAAFGAGSPVDQLSGRDDVFYPTEPNWVFIGSRSNILQIVMPNAFAAVQPFARIVIYMRGVLAQNSTSVQ